MSSWPEWNRREDPRGLLRYVQLGAAADLLPGLPLRAEDRGPDPLARVADVYAQFAEAGIRYGDEPVGSQGWQRIRPISRVIAGPREATCVDLAVAFAGACLDAGVHPVVLVLEPGTGGPAHALVAVWLDNDWPRVGGHRRYVDAEPSEHDGRVDWPAGLRVTTDDHGAFLPIDVSRLAADAGEDGAPPLEDAVAAAATMLASDRWRQTLVDVGRDFDPRGALHDDPAVRGITTHAEQVARLSDPQRNLLGERLPFVPPSDPDAPTAPHQLLNCLTEAAGRGRGVLLHGVAGIGKTRTSFEVAALALADGWAVLHIAAGEPLVTGEQLYQAARDTRSDRVLVILDYINDAAGLDYPALKTEWLPAAARSGVTLALLGCCRTGWFQRSSGPAQLVFDGLQLQLDTGQAAAARDTILATLAPQATETIGMERMRELAGARPGIVMLVAREAEALAQEGRLADIAPRLRPEDLVSWLRRRLEQDQLLPAVADNPFADDAEEPSAKLLACLAMLAAAPQPVEDLLACATAVEGLAEGAADEVLLRLRSMGWLVTVAEGLGPVHDLVTDQMTERLLLVSDTGTARPQAVRSVLGAGLTRGRTLGRFSTNLGRTVRDLDPDRARRLTVATGEWLLQHAEEAGALLAQTLGEGAYAAGALLESAGWGDATLTAWQALIGPWLTGHALSPSARHLLYKGLRTREAAVGEHLVDQALAWLGTHVGRLDATFVIRPLLLRDLDPPQAETAIRHALEWLDRYHTAVEARFIVGTVLEGELAPDDAARSVGYALAWLNDHHAIPDATYVLGALLNRKLDAEDAAPTVGYALTWLKAHHAIPDAKFVLSHLLDRELDAEDMARAVGYALAWLNAHHSVLDATYVLGALLNRELDADDTARTVGYALAWLKAHHPIPDAKFVLSHLLDGELDAEDTARAVGYAVAWLDRNPTTTDGIDFVLRGLLDRELAPDDEALIVRYALAWLDDHHVTLDATFVLRSLLDRKLPSDDAARIVRYALAWLDTHHPTADGADFVLRGLVGRELADEDAARTVGHVLAWLDLHHATADARFVLYHVLGWKLAGRDAARAVGYALGWLEAHHTSVDATYILYHLLGREMPAPDAARAVDYALAWLEAHHTSVDATYVLYHLLNGKLAPGDASRVASHALAWLDAHVRQTTDVTFVLRSVLGRDLADADAIRAVDYAMAWLDTHKHSWPAGFVLNPVLDRDVPAPAARRLRELATEWVRSTWLADLPLPHPQKRPPLNRRLADAVLDEVEAVIPVGDERIPADAAARLDHCLAQLCEQRMCWSGVPAARLDDVLRAWIVRPEALRSRFHGRSERLVVRLASLAFRPDLLPIPVHDLFAALERWTRTGPPSPDVAAARQVIDTYRGLVAGRAG